MVEKFALPFDYRIRVTNGSSEKAITVDLVETFNYLLGLLTERTLTLYDEERQYRAVLGTVQQKKVAIIWRDLNNLDLKQDKAFIENKILGNNDFDIVYVNGDSYLNNSLPIEPEFKKLMGE
jgi:adenine-specific DNA-methyltransferase